MGSGILGRAFFQAYRQALANASKTGVAQETVRNVIHNASKTMTEQEARQILGVREHFSWDQILQALSPRYGYGYYVKSCSLADVNTLLYEHILKCLSGRKHKDNAHGSKEFLITTGIDNNRKLVTVSHVEVDTVRGISGKLGASNSPRRRLILHIAMCSSKRATMPTSGLDSTLRKRCNSVGETHNDEKKAQCNS
eukprot:Gb_19717 [translate_table: standard]